MAIVLSNKRIQELKGISSPENLLQAVAQYQKSQDEFLSQALGDIRNSLAAIQALEEKTVKLSSQESQLDRDMIFMQKEFSKAVLNITAVLENLKTKQDISLVESLEKIAGQIDSTGITNSIQALSAKLGEPRPQQQYEFQIIRDQITGQIDSVVAKPIK